MSQMDPIIVPESLAQERIDRALALITGWSRTDIQDLLKTEKIFVNEKLVNKSYRLTTSFLHRLYPHLLAQKR